MCKDYVHSCLICAYAGKDDLRKTKTHIKKTVEPSGPRQHMNIKPSGPRQQIYCDVIPMPKGYFTHILLGFDAYSQYIYAIPLKEKVAFSVLQGLLSLFATVGWHDYLYFGDENSLHKAAKKLVRMAPMSVHYTTSTPYCHFRRNAEDCFQIFRELFQILDNPEEPQLEQDWALLLPTVTKSLNKRIIQSTGILGVTREWLHFKPKPPAGAPAGKNIYNKDAHENCEPLKPPDSKESKPLSNQKQD